MAVCLVVAPWYRRRGPSAAIIFAFHPAGIDCKTVVPGASCVIPTAGNGHVGSHLTTQ